jgi:hypothetical protein
VAKFVSQLSFLHLFDGFGKQPGKDAIFTVEVIKRLGYAQLDRHLF